MIMSVQYLTNTDPYAKVAVIKNGIINNGVIYLSKNASVELPTLYTPWWIPKTIERTIMRFEKNPLQLIRHTNKADVLYVFDTWGTTSYYHLLIDTIVPLWITKRSFDKSARLGEYTSRYFRFSNNGCSNDLPTIYEIFHYFFGQGFMNHESGSYSHIVYGYFCTHIPYKGPYYEFRHSQVYQAELTEFINAFRLTSNERYILVAKRIGVTRNYNEMDEVVSLLSKAYPIKYIDFSMLSIRQQIEICAGAYILLGMEGAAFANQIFLQGRSTIIVLWKDTDTMRLRFHSDLARYTGHTYFAIEITDETTPTSLVGQISCHL
jgi:Glycosyltransferase 61